VLILKPEKLLKEDTPMPTDKQLEANRRNAQRSTGPRSATGKTRSRLNALRHNLTGQVTTMTDADRAAHNHFLQSMLADLAPQGALELQLATRIAHDSWRLNRASAIEDNLFALGLNDHGGDACPDNAEIDDALTTARVFTIEGKSIQLLSLYEQRLNRGMQKNLAELKSLQSARRAHETREAAEVRLAQAAEEARLLTHLAENAAIPCELAAPRVEQIGFVYSNRNSERKMSRAERRRHRQQALPLTRNAACAA
jgi:hypothetical protein